MTSVLMVFLLAAAPAATAAPACKSCDCEHWGWPNSCKPCCEAIQILNVATKKQFVDVLHLEPDLAERVIEARNSKKMEKPADFTLNRDDLDVLRRKVSNLKPVQIESILPSIELSSSVADEHGNPIKPNEAPFIVQVTGKVHITAGLYAYLVVKDASAQWIEPSGELADVASASKARVLQFTDKCYLGEMKIRPSAPGTEYTCFAVVVDKPYNAYEHLDPATVRARSQEVKLRRTH